MDHHRIEMTTDKQKESCWFPFKEAYTRRRIESEEYEDPPNVYYLKQKKGTDLEVAVYEYDETSSQQAGVHELVLGGYPMPSSDDGCSFIAEDHVPLPPPEGLATINPNCVSRDFCVDEVVEGGALSCLEEAIPSGQLLGGSSRQLKQQLALKEKEEYEHPTSPRPHIEVEYDLARYSSYANSLIELEPHSREKPVMRRPMCGAMPGRMKQGRNRSFQKQYQDEKKEDEFSMGTLSLDMTSLGSETEVTESTILQFPSAGHAFSAAASCVRTTGNPFRSKNCTPPNLCENYREEKEKELLTPPFYVEVEATPNQLNGVRDLHDFDKSKLPGRDDEPQLLTDAAANICLARTASLVDDDSTFMEEASAAPSQRVGTDLFEEYRKRWPAEVGVPPKKPVTVTPPREGPRKTGIFARSRSRTRSTPAESVRSAKSRAGESTSETPTREGPKKSGLLALSRSRTRSKPAERVRSAESRTGESAQSISRGRSIKGDQSMDARSGDPRYGTKRFNSEIEVADTTPSTNDEMVIRQVPSTEDLAHNMPSVSVKRSMSTKISRRLRSFGRSTQRTSDLSNVIIDEEHTLSQEEELLRQKELFRQKELLRQEERLRQEEEFLREEEELLKKEMDPVDLPEETRRSHSFNRVAISEITTATEDDMPSVAEKRRARSRSLGRVAISELTTETGQRYNRDHSTASTVFDQEDRQASRQSQDWHQLDVEHLDIKRVVSWKTGQTTKDNASAWAPSDFENSGTHSSIQPPPLPSKSGSEHWSRKPVERAPSLDDTFREAVAFGPDTSDFHAEFDNFDALNIPNDIDMRRARSEKSATESKRTEEDSDWDDDDSDLNTEAFDKFEGDDDDDDDSIFSDLKSIDESQSADEEPIDAVVEKVAKADEASKAGTACSPDYSKYSRGNVSKISKYSRGDLSKYSRGDTSTYSRGELARYSDAHSVVGEPFACMDKWL
jgi:hypothetical protein